MDLETYAAVMATVAVALILAEWSYVVWWTRNVGRIITAGVLRSAKGLRPGRGKGTTAAEDLAAAAAAEEPAAPTLEDFDIGEVDLDNPIVGKLLAQVSSQSGIPVDQLKSLAKSYGVGAPKASGSRAPSTGGPAQGAQPDMGDFIGAAIQDLIAGKLKVEDAAGALVPIFIKSMMKPGEQGAGAAPVGYW